MARIDAFLKLGLAQGCSDVHLAVGVPPMLRMNGDLMPIKFRQLSDTELETYVLEILLPKQREQLEAGHDLDFSYVAEEGGRFRVNVFRKVTGIGAVFRYIPGDVPTLEPALTNYPNPFNPQTTLRFVLPRADTVELTIFDPRGRVVRRLLPPEARDAGTHELAWDGRDDAGRAVASGSYRYRLTTSDFQSTRVMTLVK